MVKGEPDEKRHSNEQIVATLRQAEGGIPVLEVCRKLGITEQTFYRWKKKYVGMESPSSPSSGSWRTRIRSSKASSLI